MYLSLEDRKRVNGKVKSIYIRAVHDRHFAGEVGAYNGAVEAYQQQVARDATKTTGKDTSFSQESFLTETETPACGAPAVDAPANEGVSNEGENSQ